MNRNSPVGRPLRLAPIVSSTPHNGPPPRSFASTLAKITETSSGSSSSGVRPPTPPVNRALSAVRIENSNNLMISGLRFPNGGSPTNSQVAIARKVAVLERFKFMLRRNSELADEINPAIVLPVLSWKDLRLVVQPILSKARMEAELVENYLEVREEDRRQNILADLFFSFPLCLFTSLFSFPSVCSLLYHLSPQISPRCFLFFFLCACVCVAVRLQYHQCSRPVYRVVESVWFRGAIILTIFFNTAALALNKYPATPSYLKTLDDINMACTVVFALEMVLKLIAYGYRQYVRDSLNLLDGFIVVSSIIELGLNGGSLLLVFRTFRLLRILKLPRFIPSLRALMATIFSTMSDIAAITFLLFLVLYMFAIVGMELFAGQYDELGTRARPRPVFDDFWMSFLAAFQVMTADNWDQVMYYTSTAAGTPAAALWFVGDYVVGVYMFLNLFIAVLLDKFADAEERYLRFEKEELHEVARSLVTAKNFDYYYAMGKVSTSKERTEVVLFLRATL